MGNLDAKQKFSEAVQTFKTADERIRNEGLDKVDTNAFKMVIIDLDAAIPGLTGLNLGRALLIKASSLYWLHFDKITKEYNLLTIVDAPPDPLVEEGLACALEGRKILEELESTEDLHWANDLVNKLGDH